LDHPRDFVAQRERQRHAAGGVEPLAAAKIGIAVLDVQVGMTEAAALDADQNFAALRLRRVDDGFTQWRIEFDERLATHQRHGVCSLKAGLYYSSMISSENRYPPIGLWPSSGSCSGFCGP